MCDYDPNEPPVNWNFAQRKCRQIQPDIKADLVWRCLPLHMERKGLVFSAPSHHTGLPKTGVTNQNAPHVISDCYIKRMIQIATR